MAEIYQLPSENSGSNNGFGNIPFSIPIGGFGSMPSGADYLKKTLDEDEKKNKEQEYAIPIESK